MKAEYFIAALIFIIILSSVSCSTIIQTSPPVAPDNQTDKPQSSVLADNQSIQTAVSSDNAKNAADLGAAVATALQSTVLIFSTNQLEMETAKNNFWDGIEILKPIISGRQVTNYPDIFRRSWKQGSGVIIDKNGYILTSRSIIEDCAYPGPCGDWPPSVGFGAQLIYVFLYENGKLRLEHGQEYIATVICKHPHDNLAVIKITPRKGDLTYASLGDSDLIINAQHVLALGYPTDILYAETWSAYKWKSGTLEFNCDPTMTSGIVSGKRRFDTYPANYTMDELNADYSVGVIQIDAALNRGNIGGPLIDDSGKVVGIGAGKLIYGEGLGFAIAINEAKELVKSALVRPITGITDGAFLSCDDNGYCCNESSWQSSGYRCCQQISQGYGNYKAQDACLERCRNNLRSVKPSPGVSQSATENPPVTGYMYNNEEYGFSLVHPFSWNRGSCSPPVIYTASTSAGDPSMSVAIFEKDKFREGINDVLTNQGGKDFIWEDYPGYVYLADGKTVGKFYLVKWNFIGTSLKTLALTIDIPDSKIMSVWCTQGDASYNEARFKEILLTLTFKNPPNPQ